MAVANFTRRVSRTRKASTSDPSPHLDRLYRALIGRANLLRPQRSRKPTGKS